MVDILIWFGWGLEIDSLSIQYLELRNSKLCTGTLYSDIMECTGISLSAILEFFEMYWNVLGFHLHI